LTTVDEVNAVFGERCDADDLAGIPVWRPGARLDDVIKSPYSAIRLT
jgi:hypothetical protein